ncbi:MAG: hypothetical protein K6A44_03750 [bacterium]|nr:hypothetical protein [bacterium]
MDFSAILAYKSLFFLNRANNTKKQAEKGDKCTAAANAARCTITASQTVVPLYAVSECLASTAKTPTINHAAQKLAESNLQKIATQMTASTTKSALSGIASVSKVLSKFGVAGNLSYAAAKCMDANEENKTQVFMQAAGNCGGMYLCENLYSRAVKDISSENIAASVENVSKLIPQKLKLLKSVKPLSVIAGVGFVAASLFGCWAGEKVGNALYQSSAPNNNLQLEPALASTNSNINSLA